MTLPSTEMAMSSTSQTPSPAITRSWKTYTPMRTSVTPSNERANVAVGVDEPEGRIDAVHDRGELRAAAHEVGGARHLRGHHAHRVQDVAKAVVEEILRLAHRGDGDGTGLGTQCPLRHLDVLGGLHVR